MKLFLENRNIRKLITIVLLIVSITMYLSYNIFFRSDINNSYALSKYGSRGDEVSQIQTKLKRWGYYNGSIDRNIWITNAICSKMVSIKKWFNCRSELQDQRHWLQWEYIRQIQEAQVQTLVQM